MNVDSLVMKLDPAPDGRQCDPGSSDAQLLLHRVTQAQETSRTRPVLRGGIAIGVLAGATAVGLGVASLRSSPPVDQGTHGKTPGGPSPVRGASPVMAVASYRLRLPNDYRLTSATKVDCPAFGVTFSSPSSSGPGHTGSSADVPQYAPEVATEANAEGGCIVMALAPPYTPTAADPDPEAGTSPDAQAVQVGPYNGVEGTSTLVSKATGADSSLAWLDVEIPLSSGPYQDLVVSSYGLSETALVSLVANGLSVDPSPSTGVPTPTDG